MSHITNSLAYRCMLSVTVGINMWKLVTHVTLLDLGKRLLTRRRQTIIYYTHFIGTFVNYVFKYLYHDM